MIIGEGNGPFKYKTDQPDPRLVVDFVNRPVSGRRRGQSGLRLRADPEPRPARPSLARQDDQGQDTMRRECCGGRTLQT